MSKAPSGARLLRDLADGSAVDQRRELFLLLRAVDGGIGGGVDDDVRRSRAKNSRMPRRAE